MIYYLSNNIFTNFIFPTWRLSSTRLARFRFTHLFPLTLKWPNQAKTWCIITYLKLLYQKWFSSLSTNSHQTNQRRTNSYFWGSFKLRQSISWFYFIDAPFISHSVLPVWVWVWVGFVFTFIFACYLLACLLGFSVTLNLFDSVQWLSWCSWCSLWLIIKMRVPSLK